MSRLKVALINTFYPPYNFGGDGVYVRRLAHALAKTGCDVHVLHDTATYKALAPKPLGPLEPLDEPPGVTVHRLESPLGAAAALITHQTGRPIANRRALERFFDRDFDVVHFHNISTIGGPGIMSMGSGIRLYTAHEHWLVCPTHVLWRHARELCDGRECVKCQLIHRRPPQFWRYTNYLERQARHIDAFIALSRSSADNHRAFGFPFEMRVLPSFLPDVEIPRSENFHAKSMRPYALFVGRLETIKGLQDIIPIFRRQEEIDLLVVGDGDIRADLEAMALGASRIRFLGRLPPEELGPLYAGAIAVILPSLCYEVFPLVALEAFRAATPIVARNLGPFPEIISKSGAGFLFDRPDEAMEAVVRLARDDNLRSRLGQFGRTSFEAVWSEKAALSAYFNLIVELSAKKGDAGVAQTARTLADECANPRRHGIPLAD